MRIEPPSEPSGSPEDDSFDTIGQCYDALEEALRRQHGAPSFPVEFDQLQAQIEFVPLEVGVTTEVAGLAVTPKLAVEPAITFNWIDLPYGAFTTKLIRTRTTYTFTPRIFASAFVQYNSTNSTFSTNLRLRWEYEPGSEFFVVFTNDQNMNPLTPDRGSEMLNRALVVKFNKLFRF